jgi:hypothetical protein
MKKKKVGKLINDALDQQLDYLAKDDNIIIAKYITKHKGKALYYNPGFGNIVACDIDFRDTHKYETDYLKLMRFTWTYFDAAKAVAISYMKNNNCGYALYTENGIIVG